MPSLIPIQYLTNSEPLFVRLRKLPYACWLDSGRPQSGRGRYDIITALPQKRLLSYANNNTIATSISGIDPHSYVETIVSESTTCPFELIEKELAALNQEHDTHLPFIGGALGYWGYELGAQIMSVNIPPSNEKSTEKSTSNTDSLNSLPDMAIGIYHWAIIQDHHQQQAYLAYLDSCDETIIAQVEQLLAESVVDEAGPNTKNFQSSNIKPIETQDEYTHKVQRVLDYIGAGDCYQVNYAQQFMGSYSGDPYTAYQHLREIMASPYSAYIDLGQQAILSLSPERFIAVNDGKVLTQPIKGTAPRHSDPDIDQRNATELLASEKNRAENVMIVDLLRNDLGKHCVPGSIKVPQLFALKSYPNVHHLVSNVTGTLAETSSSLDLLRDSFPGGSITGAPKKRAMEIIQELEQKRRGIYCGSIGYINHRGDMDTNIAIRTVTCDGNRLSCWGGGGIVADSEPEDEYRETFNKVGMILKMLENGAQKLE